MPGCTWWLVGLGRYTEWMEEVLVAELKSCIGKHMLLLMGDICLLFLNAR